MPNTKHHLILKLGQINIKFQYSRTETGLEFRSLAMFHTSAAAGLKSGQSDRIRNLMFHTRFRVSVTRCQGLCRRSNLILFVLVLVLVLEIRLLSRTKDEYDDDKVRTL